MQKKITETLVSFKVAELAKGKGFNWRNIEILEVKSKSAYLDNTTQSLLQRWLREVHNIHFITKPYIESLGKKEITGYYIPTICTSSLDKHIEFDDNYSTYEEALDEGLFQALNLLPDKN